MNKLFISMKNILHKLLLEVYNNNINNKEETTNNTLNTNSEDINNNIEGELNVVGNINIDDINSDNKPGEYYKNYPLYIMLSNNEKFLQKFYRIAEIKYNDGTKGKFLQYWGEQGGFHNSSYNNDPDRKKLKGYKFYKVIH